MDERTEELMEELSGSLRRAEHSYYVSLKYTRTIDVIKNLLERIVTTTKLTVELLIHTLYVQKKIPEVPTTLIEQINVVREHYNDPIIQEALDTMLFLRRVNRAEYSGKEEFRRHVELKVVLDDEEHKFNIDNLLEYYNKLRELVLFVRKLVHEQLE